VIDAWALSAPLQLDAIKGLRVASEETLDFREVAVMDGIEALAIAIGVPASLEPVLNERALSSVPSAVRVEAGEPLLLALQAVALEADCCCRVIVGGGSGVAIRIVPLVSGMRVWDHAVHSLGRSSGLAGDDDWKPLVRCVGDGERWSRSGEHLRVCLSDAEFGELHGGE